MIISQFGARFKLCFRVGLERSRRAVDFAVAGLLGLVSCTQVQVHETRPLRFPCIVHAMALTHVTRPGTPAIHPEISQVSSGPSVFVVLRNPASRTAGRRQTAFLRRARLEFRAGWRAGPWGCFQHL